MPITTSHWLARSVFLMNPRRSGHHVNVGVAPNSFAMRSTILFSKPSSRSFEYGKLFGSAQTRGDPRQHRTTARRRRSDRRRRTLYGREKTVSTPPRVVYSASFLYAPT